MDKQIDARFDRVDKALATLIDSITKYNPSINLANELVTADTELSKGLEELQLHQRNHARIQTLRSETEKLDTQIKETLTLLATTRKELVSTPATVFPDAAHYPIKYDELLSFARRISKTTLPPPGAANALPAELPPSKPESGTETAAPSPGDTPNGVPSGLPNNAIAANGSQQSIDPSQQTQSTNATDLPPEMAVQLNPLHGIDFIPWPGEESIRRGALANLAILTSQGIDPEGYDPEQEELRKQREAEEQRQQEEKERAEREERERKMREERDRLRAENMRNYEKEQAEGWRRASVSAGTAGAGGQTGAVAEPKRFQFMGDDDDEDDD